VALLLPTILATMDLNVLLLALPHIAEATGASSTQQLWISDVYGFLIAGFLVTMGRLGDRIGRRKLLLIGAAAFGVLSTIAAYSTNPTMLIILRALLGVAGATLMPSTLALIMFMFRDPRQMGKAIGIWASALTVGAALGPIVGGLLLNSFWWGSVFLIGVPVMALLVLTGPFVLPEAKSPRPGKLDPISVVLSLAAILPVIYGLTELAKYGFDVLRVVAVVVGLLVGVFFARRQLRHGDPLVDLRLFGIAAVGGGLTTSLLASAVQGGSALLATTHLQLVEGFSPLKAALWLLVPMVVLIIGIQVATWLAQRIRPATVLALGMLVSALGMVMLTQVDTNAGIGVLVTGVCIMYLGCSCIGPLIGQLVMVAAPPDRVGSVASLAPMAGELGLALGIAGCGSVATIAYNSQLTVPGGVPPGAAAAAKESIASAVTVAGQLPRSTGGPLLANAREAFNFGFNVTALVLAILLVGLAAIAFTTLRKIPPMDNASHGADEAQGDVSDEGTELVSSG
jgi:DHA2 family multidrug resistance protein-like MFS transporter